MAQLVWCPVPVVPATQEAGGSLEPMGLKLSGKNSETPGHKNKQKKG